MSDKTSTLLRAYLVVGEDELMRQRVCERLESYVDESLRDFNLAEFDGVSGLDSTDLRLALESLPFGDSIRLVFVRNAAKLNQASIDYLMSYLENPNPTTVVCFIANTLAKNTRLYKKIAALGKDAIIECIPKKAWELPEHVQKMSQQYGCSIARDAAAELVVRTGESTRLLDAQLKTLADICQAQKKITLADVKKHVKRTAEVKPWAFLDALCARDCQESLELLSLMPDDGLIGLHSLMVQRIRELICAKSLEARGSAQNLGQELGKQTWQVKNHLFWARSFTNHELHVALKDASKLESVLKGQGDARERYVRFVVDFCDSRA